MEEKNGKNYLNSFNGKVINRGCQNIINHYFRFIILTFLSAQCIFAQVYSSENDLHVRLKSALESSMLIDTTETNDSTQSELLPPMPKPKLLPDNISFGEKLFWGENGFFRTIGLASPLSPDERRYELEVRRFMLTAHQISGFATLAFMLGAAYFGQRTLDNNGSRSLGNTHQKFVAATIAAYSLTALLAVLSPPPLIRRDEESTTTLHKTLAWIHAAGMIITPILGSMVESKRHLNIDKAHYHQYAGYITTAVFAASLIVITF